MILPLQYLFQMYNTFGLRSLLPHSPGVQHTRGRKFVFIRPLWQRTVFIALHRNPAGPVRELTADNIYYIKGVRERLEKLGMEIHFKLNLKELGLILWNFKQLLKGIHACIYSFNAFYNSCFALRVFPAFYERSEREREKECKR